MAVLHHCFLLISISILKVRNVKLLTTLEQQRQMFKVRGIFWGRIFGLEVFVLLLIFLEVVSLISGLQLFVISNPNKN